MIETAAPNNFFRLDTNDNADGSDDDDDEANAGDNDADDDFACHRMTLRG